MLSRLKKILFYQIVNLIMSLIFASVIYILFVDQFMIFILVNNLLSVIMMVVSLMNLNDNSTDFILQAENFNKNYDFNEKIFENLNITGDF